MNVDASNLGMKGYDPVSYHQGEPLKGLDSISLTYKDVRYNFVSQENRSRFETNPSMYEPAYGGWCAWAMLEGEKVDYNPQRYKIINGKTYLFYDKFFVNTLKKWNRLANEESETSLIKQADEQWNRISSGP
jgi:YHS domain-containing protein